MIWQIHFYTSENWKQELKQVSEPTTDTNRYLYIHVHSSIIHNSQNVKVSIDWWMNKEYVVYTFNRTFSSVQSLSRVWLCDPMNCSTPGLPVHHQLLEFIQTYVHRVSDAIQPSHPLSSPSPPAPNPSQHQGLFRWVSSLHQVAKVLEFQLQHQSFQWIPRTDLL